MNNTNMDLEIKKIILQRTDIAPEQMAPLQLQNHKIALNKSQICSVMGRWTASLYNSHTIASAVDDIFHMS